MPPLVQGHLDQGLCRKIKLWRPAGSKQGLLRYGPGKEEDLLEAASCTALVLELDAAAILVVLHEKEAVGNVSAVCADD